jgi:hypothetical protein
VLQQGAVGGHGLLDLFFCGFVHYQYPPYNQGDESFVKVNCRSSVALPEA